MKIQQNLKTQPSFGTNIITNKEFAIVSEEQGWQDEIKDTFERLEARFPEDKRTIEVTPFHVMAKKGFERTDILGTSIENPKNEFHVFQSPKEIEKAIIKSVAGRKAIESLPRYTEQLNKKFGTKLSFDPRDISFYANNDAKNVAKILQGAAKALSKIHKKQEYFAKLKNDDDLEGFSLRISRRGQKVDSDLLFGDDTKWLSPKKIKSTIKYAVLELGKKLNRHK